MNSSALHQVLADYAVPLSVWFAPNALKIAPDEFIDRLSENTLVNLHPLDSALPTGPAVLVLSAEDLQGSQRASLLELAKHAHPGRSVLLGGTSDRDVLMDAINTLGVIRVVESGGTAEMMLSAVRAAAEYLRREVALTTAIDDLDIENAMLGSAIGQHEEAEDAGRYDRNTTLTTVSEGLAATLFQDRAVLEDLANTQSDELLQRALTGIDALATLMGRMHEHCSDRATGLNGEGEPVDRLVEAAAQLCAADTGTHINTHLGCPATTDVDPFALTHLIVHLFRNLPDATGIDTHQEGSVPVIELASSTEVPADYPGLDSAAEPVATSWSVLSQAGVCVKVNTTGTRVKIQLPAEAP